MKFTKRIATLLMALAMMLCLTVPAFAAEPAAQARLIVSGTQLKDKTVHATKMFTASWVDSNNDGKIDAKDKLSYTLDTAWEGLFWANGISTGTECPAGSINVTSQEGATLNEKALAYVSSLKDEGETKTLVEFAATAAKYKTTNNIEDTAAKKAENDDSVTFDQLTPGYYLVQPDKGSTSATRKTDAMLVNVPSDKAAELQLKSEYPSVEKKVDTDKTESSAQIGQKVNFTLTSKVPDMSEFDTYYFAFKDTMSKGLTFDESSVTVTIGEQTLTKDTDFKVTTAKDADTSATNITIEILNMKNAGSLTVLNETLYYRVDQILTVLPNETDALAIEKGKDYVTLVTCTPYGVNSHRLLVRGARIDYTPENGTAAAEAEAELSAWMKMPMQYRHLLLGLAVLAAILLLRALVVWMRKKFR